MRLSNFFFPILFSVLLFTNCSSEFQVPSVEGISTSVISDVTALKVSFSKPMNKDLCESAFLLSASSSSINGKFSWDSDNSFIFKPDTPLISGTYYTLTISRNAADLNGIKLKMDFIYSFYPGIDIVIPYVVSVTPADYAINFPQDGTITLIFSEAMDRTSVENNVKIYPSKGLLYNWIDDMTVVVSPIASYDFMTDYILTVGKSCSDMNANTLAVEKKIYFTAGLEFVRPTITELVSVPQSQPDGAGNTNWMLGGNFSEWTGVEKTASLRFTFSEAIDKQSFYDAFKISPGVQFSILWNTDSSCTVNFISGLEPGVKYELRILKSFHDLAGNEASDSLLLYFTVNSLVGSMPGIISTDFSTSAPNTVITTALTDNVVTNIPLASFTDGKCNIRLNFNQIMDQVSVHDKILIYKLNGLNSGVPAVISEYDWDASQISLTVKIINLQEKNNYRLTIVGGENGIKSSSGSTMNNDVKYYFIINGN